MIGAYSRDDLERPLKSLFCKFW